MNFLKKKTTKKNMQNVRKHGNINLATTEARRNYLVSEPNYHTFFFFFFSENKLAIKMKQKNKYL